MKKVNINTRLKEIKNRIKNLTKHFNYSKEVINILTICYFAITTFDPEVEDILDEVLSTTYILVNSGEYTDMLEKDYPNLNLDLDTYVEPSFDNKRKYNNDFIIITNWNLMLFNNASLINRNIINVLDSFYMK